MTATQDRIARIRQTVGDRQIDGIAPERLQGLVSGWQLATSLEYALIAEATGVTVLWLLNGNNDGYDPPTPTPSKPGTLGALRAELHALRHLPDDTVVVLAANPEGLHFSPAGLIHEGWYVGDDRSGEVYLTECLRQGMDDPDEFPPVPEGAGAVSAVVLYPKN